MTLTMADEVYLKKVFHFIIKILLLILYYINGSETQTTKNKDIPKIKITIICITKVRVLRNCAENSNRTLKTIN